MYAGVMSAVSRTKGMASGPTTPEPGIRTMGGMNVTFTTMTSPATTSGRLRRALLRHAYAAAALPVGLAALVAAPFGGAATAGRWQRSLVARLLHIDVEGAPDRRGEARSVLAHAATSLPVNLVAFALVVPMWVVFVTRGVLYPLFGADHLERSWGGPTLPGAWFGHFIQGPPLLLLVTLLLAPVARLQIRLARRYLERGERHIRQWQ